MKGENGGGGSESSKFQKQHKRERSRIGGNHFGYTEHKTELTSANFNLEISIWAYFGIPPFWKVESLTGNMFHVAADKN